MAFYLFIFVSNLWVAIFGAHGILQSSGYAYALAISGWRWEVGFGGVKDFVYGRSWCGVDHYLLLWITNVRCVSLTFAVDH